MGIGGTIVCAVVFAVILIISLSLFGSSFKIIELNTAAIYMNTLSKKIETKKIFLSGRHFIGVSGKFIKYPLVWQYITFSRESGVDSYLINGKTSDPSTIDLEITLTYRLKPEFLHKLYAKYPGQNHHTDMVSAAKDAIQKTVAKYKYVDFFEKREKVSADMSQEVNKIFKEKFNSEVPLLLLRQVFLESKFESTLISQQVNKRQAITSKANQTLRVIEGEMNVINSDANIIINQYIREAEKNSSLIRSQKSSEGEAAILNAEATSYKNFVSAGGLNFNETEFINYLYLDKMRKVHQSKIVTGYSQNTIFKG